MGFAAAGVADSKCSWRLVQHRVPTPDRDAGSARMFQILKLLAGLGRTVFVSLKPLPEYESLLWKEGVETANVVDYPKLIKRMIICPLKLLLKIPRLKLLNRLSLRIKSSGVSAWRNSKQSRTVF